MKDQTALSPAIKENIAKAAMLEAEASLEKECLVSSLVELTGLDTAQIQKIIANEQAKALSKKLSIRRKIKWVGLAALVVGSLFLGIYFLARQKSGVAPHPAMPTNLLNVPSDIDQPSVRPHPTIPPDFLNLPFKIDHKALGLNDFNNGNALTILEIRGDRQKIEKGGRYYIRGTFASSENKGSIYFGVTSPDRTSPPLNNKCGENFEAFNGSFELYRNFHVDGVLHVSIYHKQNVGRVELSR